jgi:hypothetical protein
MYITELQIKTIYFEKYNIGNNVPVETTKNVSITVSGVDRVKAHEAVDTFYDELQKHCPDTRKQYIKYNNVYMDASVDVSKTIGDKNND